MLTSPTPRPLPDIEAVQEPSTSLAVRRFLAAQGVREHNHASELARIIDVDRSQSYRRLKGDVAWSHADLRAIATHFGAAADHLLPQDEATRQATASAAALGEGHLVVPATIRVPHLPSSGTLVAGAELLAADGAELVAVHTPSGWEVHVDGHQPAGARRHVVEALTLRSPPYMQVALLEDDTLAADALVDAFRPLGVVATPYLDGDALLAALAPHRFDAFVLDWLLAEGTAAPVVEAIRQRRPTAPIVVVTGALSVDPDMEKTLLDLSARWNFSTLDKPVRPMNLANALKQLVAAARG